VWREAYLKPSEPVHSSQPTTECKICQIRPNTGLHYGVHTCEADKQFLKRTFHERQNYKTCNLQCPPRFRGWCQYCRLKSSLVTGINLKMIRIGDRTKRESKSPSLKSKKKLVNVKSEPGSDADRHVDEQLSPSPSRFTDVDFMNVASARMGQAAQDNTGVVVGGGGFSDPPLPPPVNGLAEAWLRPGQTGQKMTALHDYMVYPYQPMMPVYQPHVMYGYWPQLAPAMTDLSYGYIPQLSGPISPPAPSAAVATATAAFVQPPSDSFERARTPSQDLPLDLSSSSASSTSSRPSSRPSSRASSSELYQDRSSPSFQCTDFGNSFNKLSVNSAVLQDALKMVEGSLSPGRFANISNLSEVLSN